LFKHKYWLVIVSIILSAGLRADGAQQLSSQASVLDVLAQSRGEAVLAFIDGPADQSSPLLSLQGFLSTYSLALNGIDLGQVRRNTVLHVRPRLGLNRLKITNPFDKSETIEVSFPVMRSAGVPTSIIEIQTSRQFGWIQALSLSGSEVQSIEDALNRSQHGGMSRVLALIRSRGREVIPRKSKPINWGGASPTGEGSGSGSDSEAGSSQSVESSNQEHAVTGPSETTEAINDMQSSATAANDSSAESASDSTSSESSVSVSADQRSFY
jgi:hypothetical protein